MSAQLTIKQRGVNFRSSAFGIQGEGNTVTIAVNDLMQQLAVIYPGAIITSDYTTTIKLTWL